MKLSVKIKLMFTVSLNINLIINNTCEINH